MKLIIFKLFETLEIKVNKEELKQAINTHPFSDSLLCVSDTLKQYSIENYIVSSPNKYEFDFKNAPYPLVAQSSTNNNEFLLILNNDDSSINIFSLFDGEYSTPKSNFIENWTGVTLILNKETANSFDNSYLKNNFKSIFLNNKALISPIAITILSITIFIYFVISQQSWLFGSLVLLKFLSIYLYYNILKIEYDWDNKSFLEETCNSAGQNICKEITNLSSKPLLNYYSWGEMGFIYSISTLILVVVNQHNINNIFPFITYLGFLPILFIPYSIYFQRKILKEWCKLCTTGLLLFGIEFLLLSNFNTIQINTNLLLNFLFSLGSISILPLLIINLFKTQNATIAEARKVKNIKFNKSVFNFLISRNNQIKIPLNTNPIVLKKTNVSTLDEKRVSIFLNPSCPPCKSKVEQILPYLRGFYPELSIDLYLCSDSDINSDSYKAAVLLYASARTNELNEFIKDLVIWYKNKDIKELLKYKKLTNINQLENDYKELLLNCLKFIKRTPTTLLNERSLPLGFDVSDLKYLL